MATAPPHVIMKLDDLEEVPLFKGNSIIEETRPLTPIIQIISGNLSEPDLYKAMIEETNSEMHTVTGVPVVYLQRPDSKHK